MKCESHKHSVINVMRRDLGSAMRDFKKDLRGQGSFGGEPDWVGWSLAWTVVAMLCSFPLWLIFCR